MPAGRLRVNRVLCPECSWSWWSLSVLWLVSMGMVSMHVGAAVLGMAPVTRP